MRVRISVAERAVSCGVARANAADVLFVRAAHLIVDATSRRSVRARLSSPTVW